MWSKTTNLDAGVLVADDGASRKHWWNTVGGGSFYFLLATASLHILQSSRGRRRDKQKTKCRPLLDYYSPCTANFIRRIRRSLRKPAAAPAQPKQSIQASQLAEIDGKKNEMQMPRIFRSQPAFDLFDAACVERYGNRQKGARGCGSSAG
jgi:hypothetical protein